MARVGSSEGDYSPKHRILGAVVIVSLAVIFLPLILSEEQTPPPAKTALSKIPAAESKVFRMPASAISKSESESVELSSNARTLTGSKRSQVNAQKPTQQSITESQRKKAPSTSQGHASAGSQTKGEDASSKRRDITTIASSKKQTDTNAQTQGWIVQVGTFSNKENAQRLRDRLQQDGFLVNLQNVELKGRKAVRVRVGPYRQKHVAVEARSRIEKEVGLEGVVLVYP
ncbi:MAG: SPOR domain-containing protein [Acidiferrobacterales bacterium]